jgi:dUTP pyrophosphatase
MNSGRPIAVPVRRLDHARDLPLPAYATDGSAGLDLLAAIAADIELAPSARELVPTGITLALPHSTIAVGALALKSGSRCSTHPGVDRGESRCC